MGQKTHVVVHVVNSYRGRPEASSSMERWHIWAVFVFYTFFTTVMVYPGSLMALSTTGA